VIEGLREARYLAPTRRRRISMVSRLRSSNDMMPNAKMFDTLLQGSTVELLHSYQVAAAPVPRAKAGEIAAAESSLSASIRCSGNGIDAILTLTAPLPIVEMTKQEPSKTNPSDWICELTNQLMGRIKNRLLRFQIVLAPSLPKVLDQPKRTATRPTLVYVFRTLHGALVVTLEGRLDDSALAFSGLVNVANEGDIILF